MSRERIDEMKRFIQLAEGTWALPQSENQYRKLAEILFGSGPKMNAAQMKDALYNIYGDDHLFDVLDELETTDIRSDARPYVVDFLKKNDPLTYKNLYSLGKAQTFEAIHKGRKGGKHSIDLSGPEGNAFVLLGYVSNLGKQLGWDRDRIRGVQSEMQSGDYENLLTVFDREFGDYIDLYRGQDEDEDEGLEESPEGRANRHVPKKPKKGTVYRYVLRANKSGEEDELYSVTKREVGDVVKLSNQWHTVVSRKVDESNFREENEELEEGKWDYPDSAKGRGKPDSYLSNAARLAAEKRAARKEWRKAQKAKKHKALMRGEPLEEDGGEEDSESFYVVIVDGSDRCVARLEKYGRSWHEECVFGDSPSGFGSKTYMSYLSPEDIISWLNRDYGTVLGPFADEYEAEMKMEELATDEYGDGGFYETVNLTKVVGAVLHEARGGDLTEKFEAAAEMAYEMTEENPEKPTDHIFKTAATKAGIQRSEMKQFWEWLDEQGIWIHPSLLETEEESKDEDLSSDWEDEVETNFINMSNSLDDDGDGELEKGLRFD